MHRYNYYVLENENNFKPESERYHRSPVIYCTTSVSVALSVAVLIITVIIACTISSMVLYIYPRDIHTSFGVQGSVVTTAHLTFDQFWYKTLAITADKDVSEFFQSQIRLRSCSPLNAYQETVTGAYYGTIAIGETHTILDMLERYAYYLKGSTIEIAITITEPPSDSHGEMHLNVFNNWNDYKEFQLSVVGTASKTVYKIDNTVDHITYASINVTQDGFYFFGVDSTNGTGFYYNFTVTRYFYNSTEYLYNCTITSTAPSCVFALEKTSVPKKNSQHCILLYTTVEGFISEPFYTVNMNVGRRSFNWIIGMTIGMAGISLVLLFLLLFVILCVWCRKY